MQQIQVLTLVFVQSLDLHVEDRVGRNGDAALGFDDGGEVGLVGALDRHELALKCGRIGGFFQPAEQVEMARPIGRGFAGKRPCDQCGEARIALEQPAARRDPVGFVLKFPGEERVELRKEIFLEQRGMEGGDAVDRVRPDDREMGHTDHLVAVFLDDGADALLFVITRPAGLDRVHVVGIDFVDNLEVARQHALEEGHAPALERFRQQGVIGVGEGRVDDRPGAVPGEVLLVDEDAHELDDRDRRMRVVELHGDLGGEIVPRVSAGAQVPADDVPQRARDEEILLHEPQLFAVLRLVVRVENF